MVFHVSDLEGASKFCEEALGLEIKHKHFSSIGFFKFLVGNLDAFCKELKEKEVVFLKDLREESWGNNVFLPEE